MKKTILLLLLINGFVFAAFAQKPKIEKFSVGIETGLPVGTYKDVYSFALGASLKYEASVSPSFFITLTAGYTNLQITNAFKQELVAIGSNQTSSGFVPLKLGAKYYLSDSQFFVEGQLGASIGTKQGAGTTFIYSPGAGYAISNNFEVGIRYEAWYKSHSTFGQFALRTAYVF